AGAPPSPTPCSRGRWGEEALRLAKRAVRSEPCGAGDRPPAERGAGAWTPWARGRRPGQTPVEGAAQEEPLGCCAPVLGEGRNQPPCVAGLPVSSSGER